VTLPESVTEIKSGTFDGCTSLVSVALPEGLTSIGDYAFYECYSLTSVSLPGNLESIGYSAFSYCSSLTSVTVPAGVTSIGSRAFQGCTGLDVITFEGGAPSFDDNVFTGVTTVAYYPAYDPSWTEDVIKAYGGSILWIGRSRDPSLNGGRVTAPAGSLLVLAEYDANGRLLSADIVTVADDCTEADAKTLLGVSAFPDSYKLMLLDGDTFAPLCHSWGAAAVVVILK
jgi:hypothetical protein